MHHTCCNCQQATSSILRLRTRSRAIRFSRVDTLTSTPGTLASLLATHHSPQATHRHHSSRCTAETRLPELAGGVPLNGVMRAGHL
jgi:hypothetical protein